MSKTNDTSKLGSAIQARELRDDELQEVSGGYTFTDVMVESFFGGLGNGTLDTGAGLRRFAN